MQSISCLFRAGLWGSGRDCILGLCMCASVCISARRPINQINSSFLKWHLKVIKHAASQQTCSRDSTYTCWHTDLFLLQRYITLTDINALETPQLKPNSSLEPSFGSFGQRQDTEQLCFSLCLHWFSVYKYWYTGRHGGADLSGFLPQS